MSPTEIAITTIFIAACFYLAHLRDKANKGGNND